jgi:uncharacterized cysteine cluster protein YcgN (CxxCxxCC family)
LRDLAPSNSANACAKTKQRFSELFRKCNYRIVLMSHTMTKYKTHLFNPSDAAQKSKMIAQNLRVHLSDPGSFENFIKMLANKSPHIEHLFY